jgi:hypothetical protein
MFTAKDPRTEARFCIPCADFFWYGALCKHLWYCDTGRCFMGGGDADYPCSSPNCEGCVERLKTWKGGL